MILIKTDQEIQYMRKAGKIVGDTLAILQEAVKPGISTAELDKIAEDYIRKCGAVPSFKGYYGFPASICASVNSEVVHGFPSKEAVLKEGDIISIDCGAIIDGFHGDAARTYSVGKVSDEALRLIKVTEQSFYEGIRNAVKGNRIIDISRAVQRYVEQNGYSVVRDYVGHGIGRELWEPPQIPNYATRERGPRLEPGMTIAVEPMVNQGVFAVRPLENKWTVVTADGKLSAHYENTIAITEDEPIIMTKLRGEGF